MTIYNIIEIHTIHKPVFWEYTQLIPILTYFLKIGFNLGQRHTKVFKYFTAMLRYHALGIHLLYTPT